MKREPKKKKTHIPKERAVYVFTEEEMRRNQERESTIRAKKLFIDILERHRGIITMVCEKTNIARATYYYWRKTDKEFREKVDEITNAKPEILEDIMYVEAYKGNANAAKFLLAHHYWKKTNKEKESVVHIYHHVDKKSGKQETSFSQMVWAEGSRRRKEALAKMAAEEMKNKIPVFEEES